MEIEKQIPPNSQKPKSFRKAIIILIGIVVLVGVTGGIFYWQKKKTEPKRPIPVTPSPTKTQSPTKIPATLTLAKRLIKSEDIVLEKVDVSPQIPPYQLPLKVKDISNYQKFSEKIQLSSEALSLLKKMVLS